MSEVLRLTLVSHAMTDAMAAGRFPADEPLSDIGRWQLSALEMRSGTTQLVGPELRARQTAELMGLRAVTDRRLADLDFGCWRGRTLEDVSPTELTAWLNDPAVAPHGGESIADLVGRVAGWLESLTGNAAPTVAVTHPAVIRAAILVALDAAPKSFWRIDIAPAGRTVMHWRGGRWTVRL
ncbi:histidine phosphatase family protein [Mycobacterium sp. 94-17]|uniref:histidine phosphatase family protein n=1 Tax=Mycobacterium sp. 94-17 TaxID=2986147 RepID=UPI002D1E4D62|nr:histidine phosphatase family protein [Mycobacterium sp. 94-17]MEB4207596.1 histidine phosphatase family protein [Mycobacterium sp. 94-17]